MTLTEFLEARIAEDEAAARAAGSGPWRWEQGYGAMCNDPECPFGSLMQEKEDGQLYQLMEVHGYNVTQDWEGAAHIARHDPARVLAECAAKRRIVERYTEERERVLSYRNPRWEDGMTDDDRIERRLQEARHATAEALARALAAIYADHEDFQEEWRP